MKILNYNFIKAQINFYPENLHNYKNVINEKILFDFSLISLLDVDQDFLDLKLIFLSLELNF